MKTNGEARKDVLYVPVQNGDAEEKMVLTRQPVVAVYNLSKQDGKGSEPEKKRWPVKQFIACMTVQLAQVLAGVATAHSSSLIPRLEADDSDIRLTREQSAWVASIYTITVPVGSLLGFWVMNAAGRLNTVKLSLVPLFAAWVVLATAMTFEQLLAARLLLGASIGLGLNATLLFTTEVADKQIRGGLNCLGVAFASLGILVSYIVGAYLTWRVAAWSFSSLAVILLCLLFIFSSESPVWLRDHGKLEAAKKSSMYFYDDPDKVLSAPQDKESSGSSFFDTFKALFCTRAGLKPLIIINTLFILQQFAGIYITIYFAVTFFQESGSDLDAYVATILIGVIRVVACTGVSLLASHVGRRPLMMVSALGMAFCMLGSGLASQRIFSFRTAEETPPEWLSWVVVVCILLYVGFGSTGLQILPWSMMAEVFPHEARSLAPSVNMAAAHVYMFALLQLYPLLTKWLGGSVGVQFLFSGTCFFTAAFCWVFMIETRGLTLNEIEEYFKNNTVYLGHKKRAQRRQLAESASTTGS